MKITARPSSLMLRRDRFGRFFYCTEFRAFVTPAAEPGPRYLCRALYARAFILPGSRVKPGMTIKKT